MITPEQIQKERAEAFQAELKLIKAARPEIEARIDAQLKLRMHDEKAIVPWNVIWVAFAESIPHHPGFLTEQVILGELEEMYGEHYVITIDHYEDGYYSMQDFRFVTPKVHAWEKKVVKWCWIAGGTIVLILSSILMLLR